MWDNYLPKVSTSKYSDKVIQGNSFGSSSSNCVKELALLKPGLSNQAFVLSLLSSIFTYRWMLQYYDIHI